MAGFEFRMWCIMAQVVCLGEVLLDFAALEAGESLVQASSFQQTDGDAPANVAIEQALNILNGEKVAKEITLGSRIFTTENVDKGGEVLE
jgi:hypothetical protein